MHQRRLGFGFFVLFVSMVFSATAEMPRVELSAGIHRINAEVAHTDAMRQQGLMHRRSMAAQDGMLFVFEQSQQICMWMKNTFLPLSVAFIDDKGTVLNIEDMAPQTENAHCAASPARFALEMNQGWFQKRAIRAGNKINGIERAPAAR